MSTRTALIVRASSGIGLANAHELSAHGWCVVLAARDQQALADAARSCKEGGASDVITVAADVTDPAGVARMIGTTVRPPDLVMHTAMVMAYGTVGQMPVDVSTKVTDIAVHGTLHLARAVLPGMRQRGHGVFVIVTRCSAR